METYQNATHPPVFKTGLTYGLMLGFISIGSSLLIIAFGSNPYADNWWQMLMSPAVMIVIIVLAQKNFKATGDGYMSYRQGFNVAFTTCLISVVVGIIFDLIYTSYIDPDIMLPVWEQSRQQLESQNMSDEQIETTLNFSKKIVWVAGFFTATIIAAVISLIVTLFTQKKNPKTIQYDARF